MEAQDPDADTRSHREYASDKIITTGYITAQLNIASNNSIAQMLRDSAMFDAVSKQMIGLFTDLIEHRANKNFHENLSFLQRQGIIPVSKEKLLSHKAIVDGQTLAASLLLQVGIRTVLYSLELFEKKREFEKLTEAVAAGIAFLIGEYTLPAQNVLRKIHRENFIDFDNNKLKKKYEKYIGSEIGKLPTPRSSDINTLRDVYISILTAADLEDEAVFRKAQDLGQIYGFGSREIEEIVLACKGGTNVESDLSGLVAVSLNSILADLASSIEYAKSCARYSIDNDPYATLREKRRHIIMNSAINAAEVIPGGAAAFALIEKPTVGILSEFLNANFTTYKEIRNRLHQNYLGRP